jgi:hypothetical protein
MQGAGYGRAGQRVMNGVRAGRRIAVPCGISGIIAALKGAPSSCIFTACIGTARRTTDIGTTGRTGDCGPAAADMPSTSGKMRAAAAEVACARTAEMSSTKMSATTTTHMSTTTHMTTAELASATKVTSSAAYVAAASSTASAMTAAPASSTRIDGARQRDRQHNHRRPFEFRHGILLIKARCHGWNSRRPGTRNPAAAINGTIAINRYSPTPDRRACSAA